MVLFITLLSSVAIWVTWAFYRLYLHPLKAVPGPWLAALSTYYEMYYDLAKGGRLPWKLIELHKHYGPIVRIGPNEVHINDPDFVVRFFSSSNANRRDKHAPHQQQLGVPNATISTITSDLHQKRRAALAPFLSSPRVVSYQPTILGKIENIASRLDRCKTSGEVTELRQLFWYMATDIITEIAFPIGTNLLQNKELDSGYYNFQKTGQSKLLWFKHFPFLWTILKGMPPAWLLKMEPQAAVALRWERDNKALAHDILSGRYEGEKHTVIHHLLSSPLPPDEKGFDRIWEESTSLVGAGGETVANTLCTVIFHVLQNEDILHRLTEELRIAIPDPFQIPPTHTLASLPYLSAVVQEGLRKALGVVSRFIRTDPNQTITYGSYMLPPGTAISVSALLCNNDPNLFPVPQDYIPERWLDAEKYGSLNEKKRQVITLGGGPRRCLGEHLAYTEIYLVLAVLFRRFRLELYQTNERDIEPMYDSLLPLQWEGSQGLRVTIR
ncbi:cytochrome P450 [Delitschia confertaspora ATCC 74209]|uniref:Cytochrome P450 n=1 Tax=Delitschia confertaspora ATCC 74209 TaxID=1513339 RepID=A0A9P4JKZ0_9PLEO|nr:cytochrome P450 [Delitschia confertaspora ATCC 74209]